MSGAPAEVEILVRGRFVPVDGATVRHLRANAYEVGIPRSPELDRKLRGALDADEIVLALRGVEALQAILSAEAPDRVTLAVLLP